MRIALLSTLARIADGSPRALIALGGRPLIAWQMDLAKALNCERILCLSEGEEETTAMVEQEAAQAGLEIDFLGGPRHLLGKVTADQDIVVIGDGLLMDPALALRHFAERRGVATVPDYPGVEKGFERIDPERAWGGIIVARGSVGEQLADMPADGDTISLLLRMALQAGTPVVEIDQLHLTTGEILLARSDGDLAERERSLLDNSASHISWVGPGERLASMTARRLAPQNLNNGPMIALISGLLLFGVGSAASLYNYLPLALILVALGSFCVSVAQALRTMKARLHGKLIKRQLSIGINAITDISIISVLAVQNWPAPVLNAVFEPALLVGLWRLAAPLSPDKIAQFWRDRTSFAVILALLAGISVIPAQFPLIILLLLVFVLISEASKRLTLV